jgi:magnesium transporter
MASTDINTQEQKINSISFGKLKWINIENPTARETQYLCQNYPFHTLDVEDCLNRMQRPKVTDYDDYLFLLFHFPVFDERARVTKASQVSIFMDEDYLITLHEGNLKPLVNFFKVCATNKEAQEKSMSNGSGYLLYLILESLVNYCFPMLNRIGEKIDAVEGKVFGDSPHEAVRDLSMLRRDVLSFRRIAKPQIEVFERLGKGELHIFKEHPETYFGDLVDHSRKIMDTLDEYKEVIEGLNDTNNTLTSFRIGQVMRMLTVISTIMLPLTLIASIWGMHIDHLPLGGDSVAFPVIVSAMVVILVGMLAFFRIRRWI